MMSYREFVIEDICKIKGGKRLPKGHVLVKAKTKHPYIKARDIGGRSIDVGNLEYVTEDTFRYIKRYVVAASDVCITIVGANIGDVGIVPKILDGANLTENAVKLCNFSGDVDPHYLSYVLSTKTYKSYMETIAAGAAQPKLGLYKIQKISINAPSFDIQKKVVHLLMGYDNLIDVNNQRIKLLEKTAKELYKEWFVRMRFPGYKETKFVKGIPVDWHALPIGSQIDFNIGGGWGNEIKDDEFCIAGYVIRGTDIPGIKNGEINKDIYRYHKPSNIKSRQLLEGDIIFETAGGSEGQLLGRTCYVTQEVLDAYGDKVMAASFCKLIRTEKLSSLYLYYFLNYLYDTGMIETFQTQSTGISNYQFEPF